MLLAHVGPVHEAAFVLVPLLAFGAILYAGRRRAAAEEALGRVGDDEDPPSG